MSEEFRDFKEAREYARVLGLKRKYEWEKYCKSGYKPSKIPSSPNNDYQKKWDGIGDWLGNGKIKNRQYRSYQESKEFVRSLNLKNRKEWMEYCKSGNKPDDIPAKPWEIYDKNKMKNQKQFGVIDNSKKIIKKIRLGVSRE